MTVVVLLFLHKNRRKPTDALADFMKKCYICAFIAKIVIIEVSIYESET